MASAARIFVRPDEKQFVFIIRADDLFAIVETAELWEEPCVSASASYYCYPTVIGSERFVSIDEAVGLVVARYGWVAADSA